MNFFLLGLFFLQRADLGRPHLNHVFRLAPDARSPAIAKTNFAGKPVPAKGTTLPGLP